MKNTETERKFIIKIPPLHILLASDSYTESEITQIYLDDPSVTHRVRRRIYKDGIEEYTENTKSRISAMSAIECENEISKEMFETLAEGIEKGARPLSKIRRTFAYDDKIFEIDEYPEWRSTCIMEVELESESEKILFPPFIEILCEVTGKREYSNHSMAHRMPSEVKI